MSEIKTSPTTAAISIALSAIQLTAANSNSIVDYVKRGSGNSENAIISLDSNAAPQSVNIFGISGSVLIKKLYAVMTNTTGLTTCTGAFFEIDDGGAQAALTLNDGDISGAGEGMLIMKTDIATATMTINNTLIATVSEAAVGQNLFQEFIVTQKASQPTYLRFTYATATDLSSLDIKMEVVVEYVQLSTGASIMPVGP